ncbi:MAG: ABC transporter permease [Spirochaetales bacterium]|nr:ABC transporter permease [Spirochaetales bacterium]
MGIGFAEALDMIRHNKMRTALTMFGMNIGVAAIIAVVSLGAMARADIMGEMDGIGASLLWTYPNYRAYQGTDWSDYRPLSYKDYQNIHGFLDEAIIIPSNDGNEEISAMGYSNTFNVMGTVPEYTKVFDHSLAYGRFLNEKDLSSRRHVAVLGSRASAAFFGQDNPLGKTVVIAGRPYTVVGSFYPREQGMMGDGTDDSTVYVPLGSYLSLSGNSSESGFLGMMMFKANDVSLINTIREKLEGYWLASYGLYNGLERFRVNVAEDEIKTFNKVFSIITLVISLLAGISLVVSGIGIMNIMLVSISERTREIGIRKSLGATRSDVLMQFLIEALVVCFLGGGIGLLLGAGFSALIGATQNWAYILSPLAVGLALGLSGAVGVFFGLYPAVKASRMDPVEALSQAA